MFGSSRFRRSPFPHKVLRLRQYISYYPYSPPLVLPWERRCLSGFAHSQAFVARRKFIAFLDTCIAGKLIDPNEVLEWPGDFFDIM